MPLRAGFIKPVMVKDLIALLEKIPTQYLSGLDDIYLLGGTDKVRKSTQVVYGMYSCSDIFLCAYPKRFMQERYRQAPAPHHLNDYRIMQADVTSTSDGLCISCSKEGMRYFYCYDVFLHELGHHLDTWNFSQADREGWANWFACMSRKLIS